MGVRVACVVALAISIGGIPPSCKKIMHGDPQSDVTPDPTAPLPTLTATTTGAPTSTASPTTSSASSSPLAGDSLLALGTGEWLTYQPEGPRFSVLLPQKPQESALALKFSGGAAPGKQAISSRVGALYTIFWTDLPATFRGDSKAALDAARDDAIRNVPSSVLRFERDIKLGKNVGREFQADASAPFAMTITAHAYLVGRRIYEQTITVPSSSNEGAYVDKFMTSLAVANEGTGAPIGGDDTTTSSIAPAQPATSASTGKPAKKKK